MKPRPDAERPLRDRLAVPDRVRSALMRYRLPIALAVLAAAGLVVFALWPQPTPRALSLSTLSAALEDGAVERLQLDDLTRVAVAELADGERVTAVYPSGYGPALTETALDAGVDVVAEPLREPPIGRQLVVSLVPLLILLFFISRLLRGRMGVGQFTGGRGEQAAVPATRFVDVAGATEATGELQEIVEYLADPARYERVGARPPRGVLLVGQPGTGKTLLARAVAGEAGVPFFALSGSDFTEVFVGVGASRVRKLFDKARAAGRAIVFIDEIDAVGKARIATPNGASEEREQTLNQLLVELDGFAQSQIVVLAATNRPDVLDPALTRPGRFDRQIVVSAPDRAGREQILALYLASKPTAPLDVAAISRRCPGFTGADLANLVNQAALAAARDGADRIAEHHVTDAIATVVLGRERRGAEVLQHDREVTAWHEAGHTVAALVHPHAEDPAGVSIVPRGPAGGVTWTAGSDHQFLEAPQARARLVVLMAGRAAELMVYGEHYTQGAQGDLKAATDLATRMAAEWGMSPVVGTLHIPEELRQIGASADLLQSAVRALLTDALAEAQVLLEGNRALLEAVATRLLEDENLDAVALAAIRGGIDATTS